jgi:hypothetical protein
MQQKNIFLLLALSWSVLMMMLVSVLLFVPTPSMLSADISAGYTPDNSHILQKNDISPEVEREVILKTIQNYVENNDPDAAKMLYNELYTLQNKTDMPMGGEVNMLAAR